MDLNKHIVTNDDKKPFHSSGFAFVANVDRVGAVANTSFDQRQQIDRNRQTIAGYQRSSVGSAYSVLRAKPATRIDMNRNNLGRSPSLQRHNSLAPAPRQFSEPSARTYNPYS